MDVKARGSLAEQLEANPLFALLLDEQEADAVEVMIWANDDKTRAEGAMRVQAIRTLRTDCRQAIANSIRVPKAAPA